MEGGGPEGRGLANTSGTLFYIPVLLKMRDALCFLVRCMHQPTSSQQLAARSCIDMFDQRQQY